MLEVSLLEILPTVNRIRNKYFFLPSSFFFKLKFLLKLKSKNLTLNEMQGSPV